MEIDKAKILELLRSKGDSAKADQADAELPDKVDTDQHSGLLEKFGLSPQELIAKFMGGGGGGGLGGLLGR